MFKITEGQYALGGLTVFAVWLFVILPLLHYFGAWHASEGAGWLSLASTVVTAFTGGVVAVFTVVLACVGRQQIADTRILQRAYVSVEPRGIATNTAGELVGQVAFKNVGKLSATEFVSVVMMIKVHHAKWVTPILTDNALPTDINPGLVPIGAKVPQGSGGITSEEIAQVEVTDDKKYLYVWGRAKFKDGFDYLLHS